MTRVFQLNDSEFWAGDSLEVVLIAFKEQNPEGVIDDPVEIKLTDDIYLYDENDRLAQVNVGVKLKEIIDNGGKFPCVLGYAD